MKIVLKESRIHSSDCLADSELLGFIIDWVVRLTFGLA